MEGANFDNVFLRVAEAAKSTRPKDLAKFLGISAQAVSKALNQRKIPQSWLQAVSTKNNLSLQWLMFGIGTEKSAEGAAVPNLQAGPVACPRCAVLNEKLVLAQEKLVVVQERENALLKECHALRVENMQLKGNLSLSHVAGDCAQANTA